MICRWSNQKDNQWELLLADHLSCIWPFLGPFSRAHWFGNSTAASTLYRSSITILVLVSYESLEHLEL